MLNLSVFRDMRGLQSNGAFLAYHTNCYGNKLLAMVTSYMKVVTMVIVILMVATMMIFT